MAGSFHPALIAVLFAVPAYLLAHERFTSDPLVLSFQTPPSSLVVGAVLGLASLNALGEELLWRQGLLLFGQRVGVPRSAAVLLVAASFGLAHLHGIPNGWTGVALAGLFGVALGFVRLRNGLLAAVAIHFVVDMAVFSAVTTEALYLGIPGR